MSRITRFHHTPRLQKIIVGILVLNVVVLISTLSTGIVFRVSANTGLLPSLVANSAKTASGGVRPGISIPGRTTSGNAVTGSTAGEVVYANTTGATTSQAYDRYEAEQAQTNAVVISQDKSTASNGSIVGNFGLSGQYISFTVKAESPGIFASRIRYAAADATNPRVDPLMRLLTVNGVRVSTLSIPRTGDSEKEWNSYVTRELGNIALNAGVNTVTLSVESENAGFWDVDYIEVANPKAVAPIAEIQEVASTPLGVQDRTVRFEAERAATNVKVISEGVSYASDSALLGSFSEPGNYATFTVSVPATGEYRTALQYVAADWSGPQRLTRVVHVNEEPVAVIELDHTGTGSGQWDQLATMDIGSLPLRAGANTISFRIEQPGSGSWDLDYIEVAGASIGIQDIVREAVSSATPSTPRVSAAAIAGVCLSGQRGIYVATNGDDGNPGTEQSPLSTIGAAVRRVSAGQNVYIKNGTYREDTIRIDDKLGTPDAWMGICAYPGHRPKIMSTAPWQLWSVQNSSYIEWSGLEFEGNARRVSTSQANGFEVRASNYLRLYDLAIHDFGGAGIAMVEGNDHLDIRGNSLWGNAYYSSYGQSAIVVSRNASLPGDALVGSYRNLILGNLIWGNEQVLASTGIGQDVVTGGACIALNDYSSSENSARTLAKNNICVDNGAACLSMIRVNRVDWLNNTCYTNVRHSGLAPQISAELVLVSVTDSVFRGNVVLPRNGATSVSIVEAGANNQFSDNVFLQADMTDTVLGAEMGSNRVLSPGTRVFQRPDATASNGDWAKVIEGDAGATWPLTVKP